MTAVVSLLIVIFVSLLVTRVATIALAATGLSRESARFQARSAFTGSGFTTAESEQVVRHPVRRRIVMLLMLLGNAGIVAVIASFVLTFLEPGDPGITWFRVAVLVGGLIGLWALANSPRVDRWLTALTVRALRRWTDLDTRDYAALLHVGGEYVVTELAVDPGHWLADRTLRELKLRDEGVIVLGVERAGGSYVGIPDGDTVIAPGDVLLLYSRAGTVAELDRRRRDAAGARSRRAAVKEQKVRREAEN